MNDLPNRKPIRMENLDTVTVSVFAVTLRRQGAHQVRSRRTSSHPHPSESIFFVYI